MTATTPTAGAPAPAAAPRCPTCGGSKLTPAGRCRLCPVRVTLTPLGRRALAAAR